MYVGKCITDERQIRCKLSTKDRLGVNYLPIYTDGVYW